MTLQQIDKRLSLFSDYLKYRVDAKWSQPGFTYTPQYILNVLEKHGFLINLQEIGVPLLNFDQWLVLYKHEGLVLSAETIVIGTNPMMQVAKYGGQTSPYEVMGSFDMFQSIDNYIKDHYETERLVKSVSMGLYGADLIPPLSKDFYNAFKKKK